MVPSSSGSLCHHPLWNSSYTLVCAAHKATHAFPKSDSHWIMFGGKLHEAPLLNKEWQYLTWPASPTQAQPGNTGLWFIFSTWLINGSGLDWIHRCHSNQEPRLNPTLCGLLFFNLTQIKNFHSRWDSFVYIDILNFTPIKAGRTVKLCIR